MEPLPDYRQAGSEVVDHQRGAYNLPHQRTSWNFPGGLDAGTSCDSLASSSATPADLASLTSSTSSMRYANRACLAQAHRSKSELLGSSELKETKILPSTGLQAVIDMTSQLSGQADVSLEGCYTNTGTNTNRLTG